jgi:hypothetical protein
VLLLERLRLHPYNLLRIIPAKGEMHSPVYFLMGYNLAPSFSAPDFSLNFY